MFGFASSPAETIPTPGQTAPGFTLPSQDGSSISLEQFKGKWVVLYFYPKDNTPVCTREARNFESDQSEFSKLNTVILGVSVDSAASHKDFCAKQGLTFKLLADSTKRVAVQYGSLRSLLGFKMAARNTFLIDPAGKIAKVWTGVDASEHSRQVLQTLQQLQKGG